MLFEAIYKYTEKDDPDYQDLRTALQKITEIAEQVKQDSNLILKKSNLFYSTLSFFCRLMKKFDQQKMPIKLLKFK